MVQQTLRCGILGITWQQIVENYTYHDCYTRLFNGGNSSNLSDLIEPRTI